MQAKQAEPGGGLKTVKGYVVSTRAPMHFMQNSRIRRCGNPPPLLPQAKAEFRVLPVKKETLVQQSDILKGLARNQHAGAVKRVEPIIGPRICAVAPESYPQIHSRASPCFHSRGRISVVADGGDSSNLFIGQGLPNQRREGVRSRLRIVVQQPYIICTVGERISNSQVVATRETEIGAALKEQNIRAGRLNSRNRVIRGSVVHDQDRQVCIRRLLQCAETLDRVSPPIPIEDYAKNLRAGIQASSLPGGYISPQPERFKILPVSPFFRSIRPRFPAGTNEACARGRPHQENT